MERVASGLVFWRGNIPCGTVGTNEWANRDATWGSERQETAMAKAERLLTEELKQRGWK